MSSSAEYPLGKGSRGGGIAMRGWQKRLWRGSVVCVAVVLLGGVGRSSLGTASRDAVPKRSATHVAPRPPLTAPLTTRIPVSFERNDGQVHPDARFLARARGYTLFVRDGDAVVVPAGGRSMLAIAVAGAREGARPAAQDALAARSNYLHGNDRAKWVRGVPHFARIRRADVLPGIDQSWHTRDGRAEFRFEVAPGADASGIALTLRGADDLRIDDGRLVARLADGEVRLSAPVAYQPDDDARTPVAARYALEGKDRVRIALGAYDGARALIIDPEIEATTYYGGSRRERLNAVAIDTAGACYVTGSTSSSDLPTTAGSFQPVYPDTEEEIFLAKLTPDLSALVYATYFGGDDHDDGDESGDALAVDAAGNAVVAGKTYSSDFPLQNAFQATKSDRGNDLFVTQFDADGASILFSSYLGGSFYERTGGLALDAAGNIYVAGWTASDDFPLANPFQSTHTGFGEDAFVARIRNGVLAFSTYFGGTAEDFATGIAVDEASTAPGGTAMVIAGWTSSTDLPTANAIQGSLGGGSWRSDGFVARFTADGSALTYSTYLGGSDFDQVRAVTTDATGAAYVTGQTYSLDFPGTGSPPLEGGATKAAGVGSAPHAFVSKLSPVGEGQFSTLIGGNGTDEGEAIALDSAGALWVVGNTTSPDFPLVDPVQDLFGETGPIPFLCRLDGAGSALLFSTYLDGTESTRATGLAIGADDAVFVAGVGPAGLDTTAGAFQTSLSEFDWSSGFVTKFAAPGNVPPPNTIRSFILPKRCQITVPGGVGRRQRKPGAKITAYFDSGPDDVDLSLAATLTLGGKEFVIPALTPVKGGKSFVYKGQGLSLDIRPSPIGSSRGKLTVSYEGDLGPGVDVNGAFLIRFTNASGIDATGECVLSGGSFTFGEEAGELIAPELSIRKAKAKLPGVGKHTFKFVAGFTTGGKSPTTAPSLHISFGRIFAADIPSKALVLRGKNFRLTRSVSGIDAFTLTYSKERISVRGGHVDLGDIKQGPTPVLLVFSQGTDVRAVFIRMVRKGKTLKY